MILKEVRLCLLNDLKEVKRARYGCFVLVSEMESHQRVHFALFMKYPNREGS